MTEKEQNILKRIEELFINREVSNEFIVENIKLAGQYLNLQTVSDYAKTNKISYPAAMKNYNGRKNIELFNVKFVIDND